MFNVAVLKDMVRITPDAFGKNKHTAIVQEINSKFANKVWGYAACMLYVCMYVWAGMVHHEGNTHASAFAS